MQGYPSDYVKVAIEKNEAEAVELLNDDAEFLEEELEVARDKSVEVLSDYMEAF